MLVAVGAASPTALVQIKLNLTLQVIQLVNARWTRTITAVGL
ncbi:hypothetical protein [Kitasatospora sp. NPDC004272]